MTELHDIKCLQCDKKMAVAYDKNPNVFVFPQYLFCSTECAMKFSNNPSNKKKIDEIKAQHFGYVLKSMDTE
jgi:hypothetical protein